LGAFFCARPGIAQAPGLIGPVPASTQPPDTSAADAKLDAAIAAAASIISGLDGDAQKQAEQCLSAFVTARKGKRVRIAEFPPAYRRAGTRAYTTPDEEKPRPRYKPGQTAAQFVWIDAAQVARLCPLALAVLVLHEGWRLEQSCFATPETLADYKEMTANSQQQMLQDIKNISAAGTSIALPPAPADADCLKDLSKLKDELKATLANVNQLAQKLGIPEVPVPN
jgi:hypothetical protein